MTQPKTEQSLHDLGYAIFLDRYTSQEHQAQQSKQKFTHHFKKTSHKPTKSTNQQVTSTAEACSEGSSDDTSGEAEGESSGDDDDSEPATLLIQLNANILDECKSLFACYSIPPEIVNLIRNHASSGIVIFVPIASPPNSRQKSRLFVKWLLVIAFALCFIWIFASPSIEPFVGVITTLATYLQLD